MSLGLLQYKTRVFAHIRLEIVLSLHVLNRGFNNEVQHLEKQEGACDSKCVWEINTGI